MGEPCRWCRNRWQGFFVFQVVGDDGKERWGLGCGGVSDPIQGARMLS